MPELAASPRGRVYHVDDDEIMCQLVQKTLATEGYEVESFRTAEAFLAIEIPNEPCCLLVDVVLPQASGIELCRELVKRQSACSIVFMSGRGDITSSVEAMKLGAMDFLQKPCGIQKIRDTVAMAMQKSQQLWEILQEELTVFAAVNSLTPREKEILESIAEGLLSKEIAKKLGISHRTVDVHRSHIMEKLHVQSPTQLANIMFVMQRRQQRINALQKVLSSMQVQEPPQVNSDSHDDPTNSS